MLVAMTRLADDAATVTWETGGDPPSTTAWFATIVVHPDPQWLGRRAQLDGALALGRTCTVFGDGALDDAHTSRHHAELRLGSDDALELVDLGSHNGTFVEGRRISTARITEPTLVGVGRIVLALDRDVPAPHEASTLPELVGGSGHHLRATAAAITLAERGRPLHVVGEAGVGKSALVRALHEHARGGPFVTVAADDPDTLARIVAAGPSGTLHVERLERAEPHAWALLLRLLDANSPGAPWLALTTRAGHHEPVAALESAHVRAHLGASTVRLAPLRRRRADIALLVRHAAQRYAGDDVIIDPRLMLRLLQHAWPGNIRELDAVIERIVLESPHTDRLVAFDGLDEILGVAAREPGLATHAPSASPFLVAADGGSFTTADGVTVDLGARKILARVLATLVDAHHTAPGRAVAVGDLLRAAWPGERFQPRAGANRVYVALTTLRRMGLRDLIARVDGGYAIEPNVALRIVAARAP
jgi:hypothetical protein